MTPGAIDSDPVIFGVDVQSGDVRGDAPTYALAILDDEAVSRTTVSYRKLRREIERVGPDVIATDNVYELATDRDDLVQLLRELPAETDLVQVTGGEDPEPLSRVASRYGVPYDPEPMAEAVSAARLAALEVGTVVSAFEERTEVRVTRGRSTGSGGYSEDRFTRKIHGAVKRRAREVDDMLADSGLSFDREVTEKYGGWSRAVFTVEGTPDTIPVSAGRSGDVRVEIEQHQRDGIAFEPLSTRRDYVIVGIDPGTTTAVGLVDLDGSIVAVTSTRTADSAEIVEWVIDRGRPVIVAADVTPMPHGVEDIRRSFAVPGWTPASDLPVDTKQHRVPDHAADNDHERDALAAALFAFDSHEDQFDRIATKVPPAVDRGQVTARVLAEESSVEAVLAAMERGEQAKEETTAEAPKQRELTAEERKIRDLEAQVERLQSHVEDLEGTIEAKDGRIEELEIMLEGERTRKLQEIRQSEAVSKREEKIELLEETIAAQEDAIADLEGTIERLKTLWRLDHSNFADVSEEKAGLVPVKPIDEFTKTAIREAKERYGLAVDDVIYLRDAAGAGRSTAELLADVEPRVVLREGGSLTEVADEVLFEAGIPVGPAADVAMQEVDDLAVARESDVEDVIADWEERAKARRREQNAAMVDQVIAEYRVEERDV